MPKLVAPYPSRKRCPECVYWSASSAGGGAVHAAGDPSNMLPHHRHLIASSRISSSQNGQRFTTGPAFASGPACLEARRVAGRERDEPDDEEHDAQAAEDDARD